MIAYKWCYEKVHKKHIENWIISKNTLSVSVFAMCKVNVWKYKLITYLKSKMKILLKRINNKEDNKNIKINIKNKQKKGVFKWKWI